MATFTEIPNRNMTLNNEERQYNEINVIYDPAYHFFNYNFRIPLLQNIYWLKNFKHNEMSCSTVKRRISWKLSQFIDETSLK